VYELCTKNGILLDVIVYSGDMTRELLCADEDLLTSESIPLTLMQPYLGKGYRLFVDNFYTSPRLAQFLLKNNVTLVDTVRASRHGFPADLAAAAVERGETKFALSNNGVAYCSQIQVTSRHSLTHSLTSRPSSMRVGDSRRPLRYLSSPLCSIL